MSSVVTPLPTAPATASMGEIRRVFEAQREAALRLRTSTAAERKARIRRLRDAVLDHTEAFYEAAAADCRKPPAEVDLTELLPVMSEASDALRHVKGWMKPQRVWPTRMMFGTSAWVKSEPRGRCLIISPWNYPVNLTFGPLVSALAAGNTAILKPSEMTPALSGLMGKIVKETFPVEEVALFEGDAEVSKALLDLPFDHVFFTGSPAIGKVVMGAAAKHLTSVTLELGGKSPTIIDASADLRTAARTIVWGKFTNCGQTCIAPDHVYVHESVRETFVAECTRALGEAYGDAPGAMKDSPDYARMVNARHTRRVADLLEDAKAKGARVLCGGDVDVDGHYIAPTLIDGAPEDARVMQEEIFGPLLPIIPFRSLDDVIGRINAMPKPLALYVWAKRREVIDQVMENTSSGSACVNHAVVQYVHGNLPFGGVNNSGMGSAHGHHGFRTFSHERAVVRGRLMLARMFFPPYSDFTRMNITSLLKSFKFW